MPDQCPAIPVRLCTDTEGLEEINDNNKQEEEEALRLGWWTSTIHFCIKIQHFLNLTFNIAIYFLFNNLKYNVAIVHRFVVVEDGWRLD